MSEGGEDTRKILAERGKTHGNWIRQAILAQRLKVLLLREEFWDPSTPHMLAGDNQPRLTPQMEEGIEMICVKLSRIVAGNPAEIDHWRDIAGYATLVADAILE